MSIDKKTVEHVAYLARIALDDAELERLTGQLEDILTYIEQLKTVDVENVEPTSHVLELCNIMRTDDVQPSLSREEALANAPESSDGAFKVPRIIAET